MRYTSEQLDKINNSIPIVEYASKYLKLKPGTGRRNNEYWTHCCFHEGDTNSSLSFNSDKNVFRCMACDTKGGLINFVMEYHKKSFMQAIDHILKLVDIPFDEREYSEIVEYLYKINRKLVEKEIIVREFLSKDIMNQYTKEPIIEWINEGIQQDILDKYDVRYNKQGNAIVFPICDINGNIISVKARTLYKNHADLGIPKYTYYQKIITNDFLFGLYENMKYIKEKNEVIVFEGCKSPMLAEEYGYLNCVSLETNNINEHQINLLLQLKCNIVMALDKGMKITDKQGLKNTKDITYINIGLLSKFTNVYTIEDDNGLLSPKASPVDCGKEIFDKLYKEKIKI
jgi:DNA primase